MGSNETIQLRNVCVKIGSGATPRGGKESYKGGDTSLIRSQNIYNDGFHRDGIVYIDDDQAAELGNVEVMPEDVLLNITGDSVARCCQVVEDVLPARVNQHVAIIRPQQELLDARFLRYVLISNEYQSRLLALASAGATRPALTKTMIEDLNIPSPPLAEQKAVAGVLGALDDKIELNRRMNETLEAMARALFKSWFVDFDPVRAKLNGRKPIGIDKETAALFPSDFQDSALGPIPQGWSLVSLSELMDLQGGTQPPASEFLSTPTDGYVRLIQIRDYESDSHLTFVKDTQKLRKCRLDDVMIARYGASVARICWGLEGAYNVALVKAAPKNPCFREYLRSYLQTHDFQSRLIGMSNRSVQAGFNKGDIASFQIAVPNNEIFEKYQNVSWGMRNRILHNKVESRTLAALRDSLLPQLLSGDLKVRNIEYETGARV